jgi:hypothetical protein
VAFALQLRKKYSKTSVRVGPYSVYMILIYWTEAYIMCIKKNAEALVVVSKENGAEVNANKTKYMIMSRDQNVE